MGRKSEGDSLHIACHDPAMTDALGDVVVQQPLSLTLALVAGRIHGPVVPSLPYLDLVVVSPMPRRVTLARHWGRSRAGVTLGGLLVGTVVGAGLAISHLAVPVSAWTMTSIAVGIGLTLLGLVTPAALAWALVWSLSIGGLLAATHLMAAFRGLPPIGVFGPRAGMPAMVFWCARPLLSTLVVGTATAADGGLKGHNGPDRIKLAR